MGIEERKYMLHTAHLDAMNGVGMLVMPSPATDITLDGSSIHWAEGNAVLDDLEGKGWVPLTDDEDGRWIEEGTTPEGLPVMALYGLDPITSAPSFDEIRDANNVIADAIGLVRPI